MIATAFTFVVMHELPISPPPTGRHRAHQDPPKEQGGTQRESAKPKPAPKPTDGAKQAGAFAEAWLEPVARRVSGASVAYMDASSDEGFRFGAAAYCERYFKDTENSDPTWPLTWSVRSIVNKGGLDPLQKIIDLELSVDDAGASGRLINEGGLLVDFVVDGDCKPAQDAHQALVTAIAKGEGVAEAGKSLQAQILKSEAKLRTFAGL